MDAHASFTLPLPSAEAKNWTPADSEVDRSVAMFRISRFSGTPSASSMRLIVETETPDADASSRTDQFKSPRDART